MKLTKKQQIQEQAYAFPYHYLNLVVPEHRLVHDFLFLSRLEAITRSIRSLRKKAVLDAGCGDGRLLYEFKKKGFTRLTGVDFSEAALRFARAFVPDATFYRQDLTTLSLSERFDAIVLAETLEHIPPKSVPAVLKRLRNHLKPHGRLIITVPSTRLPTSPKHYRHFTPETLTETVSPFFTVTRITGLERDTPFRTLLAWFRRLGLVILLFRKRLQCKAYFRFLRKFYDKFIAYGPPDRSIDLLAECKPR